MAENVFSNIASVRHIGFYNFGFCCFHFRYSSRSLLQHIKRCQYGIIFFTVIGQGDLTFQDSDRPPFLISKFEICGRFRYRDVSKPKTQVSGTSSLQFSAAMSRTNTAVWRWSGSRQSIWIPCFTEHNITTRLSSTVSGVIHCNKRRQGIWRYRPQPTRRTSWKLVGNPGFELVSNQLPTSSPSGLRP